MIWQVLDVRAVWIKELAAALSRQVPTLGWIPNFKSTGILHNREEEFSLHDPPLTVRSFPLQRGFARYGLGHWLKETTRIGKRLSARSGSGAHGPLVCTAPQYAEVAEQWPGPTIYYATDYFPAYQRASPSVRVLERRMSTTATLVCVNSERIRDYLAIEALCRQEKLVLVPNATRAENILPQPASQPAELPNDLVDLPRPVAGVMGNLGDNTDWVLLREVIERTPWLSWAFIGPAENKIVDRAQRESRRGLMRQMGRVRFIGERPYAELKNYARSFDVAVLPYQKIEPTYSGSSTRFYEHLAASRPMIATPGCAELLSKEPQLRLVNNSAEFVAELEQLRERNFRDEHEELRWQASRTETWEHRAAQMIEALAQRAPMGRDAAA